jgi:hypothetical protein
MFVNGVYRYHSVRDFTAIVSYEARYSNLTVGVISRVDNMEDFCQIT